MKIKLFTFPNILTLCNLLCGAGATVAALRYGDLFWPLVLIVTAAVFDFLDGFAARLLKSYSPLGKELDSLADCISFGMAPAAVLLNVYYAAGGEGLWGYSVFVLAAFFAGMAGVLYGHTLANIKPAMFDYNMSIEILVIVVLGGMGSIRGSIIATIILRALPEVLRQVADYRMLAYSVLLIVIMLLNSSPQFAEWKGRWSLKALLSLGKTRKEKTKKEAAKK